FLQFLQRLGGRRDAPTLVFVTHHVEEIMPVFSHALILKAGRVLAAGKKSPVLNAGNLSRAFNTTIALSLESRRYALAVRRVSRQVL
ncbi:MAG: transporter ATP-binding protein, partial [Pedosphaera sp.]|nr:transporter ATP-binding protein [Pedosphaera sp.]